MIVSINDKWIESLDRYLDLGGLMFLQVFLKCDIHNILNNHGHFISMHTI